jgi:hypothetical protein
MANAPKPASPTEVILSGIAKTCTRVAVAFEDNLSAIAGAITRMAVCAEQGVALLQAMFELTRRQETAPLSQLESGFACRDEVQLEGRELRVNDLAVKLTERQAVLVGILLQHALAGDRGYLTTTRIIEEIERDFAGIWSRPIPADMYTVVYEVRKKLGLSRRLLQKLAKNGGYRISTPMKNIVALRPGWKKEIKELPNEQLPKLTLPSARPEPNPEVSAI